MPRTVIVIPCYNEAERLEADRFREYVGRFSTVDFVFVNDGSTDATAERLEALVRCRPDRFRVLHLPNNLGKAEAVRAGVREAFAAGATYIGYWDADQATPLSAIAGFIAVLERRADIDLVMGSRMMLLGRRVERQWLRGLLGRLFARVASTLLGLPIRDTQCGAKLFRAVPEIAVAFAEPFQARWVFDVEILARLLAARRHTRGVPVAQTLYELPLEEWRDVSNSHVRSRDFARAVRDLAAIYGRYLRPGARWRGESPSAPSVRRPAAWSAAEARPRRAA